MPIDPASSQDDALAALTRRVAEIEHRLSTMKIIVGLVLTGKIVIVLFFVYIFFGNSFPVRSRGPNLQNTANTQIMG